MTALLWLLAMVPPSALFLIAGIWVVKKKYGGVRHVLGVAAIVVGLLLVAITLVVLPGIATTTTSETTVTDSNSASLKDEVIVGGVGITLGRAVLNPDERVTLFYVGRDTAGELGRAMMIDSAEITSSDGRSWLADGHGVVFDLSPLTLGWLTFPVPDAAPGSFEVTVNRVQVDSGHATGSWQLPRLPGLEARSDVLEPIVIDSDLCVSNGSVAFGFHERACAVEFIDPRASRQPANTPKATGVTPRPTPTPTQVTTIQPTLVSTPQGTKSLDVADTLSFTLCTPWHFLVSVGIDDTGTPGVGSEAPTTATRCVLP